MFHGINPYYYSAYHILIASQQSKSNKLSIDKRLRHFRVTKVTGLLPTHPTVFQLPLLINPFRSRDLCVNEYLKYILLSPKCYPLSVLLLIDTRSICNNLIFSGIRFIITFSQVRVISYFRFHPFSVYSIYHNCYCLFPLKGTSSKYY